MEKIINKLKRLLQNGPTLVYFASGSKVREEYSRLPYKNIILVDKCFASDRNNPVLKINEEHKIICLGMDGMEAVYVMQKAGVMINCFVCINEGLSEGGGHYVMNSDIFLGYTAPILSDEFIHIAYKAYYGSYLENGQIDNMRNYHLVEHWLDIPYDNKRILDSSDPGYINPVIFTSNKKHGEHAEVTLLSKPSAKSRSFRIGQLNVNVRHESIWKNISNLDASFMIYENNHQKEIIERLYEHIYPIEFFRYNTEYGSGYSRETPYKWLNTDDIIKLCNEKGLKIIGFIPNKYNYLDFLKRLSEETQLERVIYFHLNKDDFEMLYNVPEGSDLK